MKRAALVLFAALLGFGQTKVEKSALDKATLEAYLRNVELFLPTVTAKIDDAKPSTELPGFYDVWVHWTAGAATKDEMVYVSKDGKHVIQIEKGGVFDINRRPFEANLAKLKTDDQPSFGPPKAPVTMVVFSDFQCPVCKEESQILRENLRREFPDKVRVVFKDYPLDSIHEWAHTAALAGRCVFQQNPAKFWDYFDWVYDQQQNIGLDNLSSKLQSFATEKGVDGVQLGRCVDNKTAAPDLTREITEGHALLVSSTPTMFINGRKLEGGIPWTTLDAVIKLELDHQAKEAASADKCCEVTLPKIVK